MQPFFLITWLCAIIESVGSIKPPAARHNTLSFKQRGNVTHVTIDNPPINLLDVNLISDLYDFLVWTKPGKHKTTPKVVVFSSNNPNFFLSHIDYNILVGTPTKQRMNAAGQATAIRNFLLNITSTAFIAEINGRTTGGGQELALSMDMRFAGPRASAVNFENAIGASTGAGGQENLGYVAGRPRTMEYILGAKAFDGPTGEKAGVFNTYYASSDQLSKEVCSLADRIGLFPQQSLNNTKFALQFLRPSIKLLTEETERTLALFGNPETLALNQKFLKLSGKNNAFEYGIPDSILKAFYGVDPK